MAALLEVRALEPMDGRRTEVTWLDHPFSVFGDSHVAHGGESTGPDGFDLIAAALGQCLLNTLLAKAQRDGIAIQEAKAVVSIKARLARQASAPYISHFRVDIHLQGGLDEPVRASLEQWARTKCGVRETLLRTPRIEEHVHLAHRFPG